MRKQLVIIGIAVLLVSVVFLSGCAEQKVLKADTEKNKFIGHWLDASIPSSQIDSNNTVDFFSNGTCKYFNISAIATWKLEVVNTLIINFPNGTEIYPFSIPFQYVFSNNNKTLTLTNGLSSYSGPTFILTKE